MKRKIIIVISICSILIALCAGLLWLFAVNRSLYDCKHSEIQPETLKGVITELHGNEFGEPEYKGLVDKEYAGEKISFAIFEDCKYKYNIGLCTGDIYDFEVKDRTLYSVNPNIRLTKEEITAKSKFYLSKYAPDAEIGQTLELIEYTNRAESPVENVHMVLSLGSSHEFYYKGIASNGIKTGERVSMKINQCGELVDFCRIKGNLKIAKNTKPKISSDEAVSSAWQYVCKNHIERMMEEKLPSEIYLEVWGDKLVYNVEFKDVNHGLPYPVNYDVCIDAQTGDILSESDAM